MLCARQLPRGNQRNSFFSRYGFACFLSVEREYSSTAAQLCGLRVKPFRSEGIMRDKLRLRKLCSSFLAITSESQFGQLFCQFEYHYCLQESLRRLVKSKVQKGLDSNARKWKSAAIRPYVPQSIVYYFILFGSGYESNRKKSIRHTILGRQLPLYMSFHNKWLPSKPKESTIGSGGRITGEGD